MRSKLFILSLVLGFLFSASPGFAYYNPKEKKYKPNNGSVQFREACTTAKKQVDQDVNNVRARLTTGGDVWWDRSDGKYVVPKVAPGETEVSSIFAGAVWLGGVDPGGNLKTACQLYGNSGNRSDFWPGPIHPEFGTTEKEECARWDRFFEVSSAEIRESIAHFKAEEAGNGVYTEEMIPEGVKGWPAKGNPYFIDVHPFGLPDTDQGLAGFYDNDADGFYDPRKGDFPVIEIRGCEEEEPQFPDEMIFWIYNDEGGGATHGETNGNSIRMEVQVQAFGYQTADQLNDMTFQRYKLINRAKEDIDSTYFAMWVDADLGCSEDDYVGCDTSRSLAYYYNADAQDGDAGITCTTGAATYGTAIPMVAIDYFRGPRNEFLEELGMSSFTVYNRAGSGPPPPPPGTTDPDIAQEYYNYLRGYWKDGTPYTFGGSGYNPGSTDFIRYAFVDNPEEDGANVWNMCTETLPAYDRRTVQASGPFKLQPGAVNELIIGVPWIPNVLHPCPDITRLQFADDLAQTLFDNCFNIVDGPDAPDIDWVELDRELVAVLTNNSGTSNNAFEAYQERGLDIPSPPAGETYDTMYRFEGYLLYQLAGPTVGPADYDDPSKARLIYQVDVQNGIGTIYNWVSTPNPYFDASDPNSKEDIYYPEVVTEGKDEGIRHTFKITEDQFASGLDKRLVNHRRYYFSTLAYAHNEYLPFDPVGQEFGQKNRYIAGRNNRRTYAPIPRPILDKKLNAQVGDGPIITRIDGAGVGGNFIDITDETKAKMLNGTFDGEIVFKEGRGPINVSVYNPLEVKNGEFELTFVDGNLSNNKLDSDTRWQLRDLGNPSSPVLSDATIFQLNEQIFGEYGFTITVVQTPEPGDSKRANDGGIGIEEVYNDEGKPFWYFGVPDEFTITGLPPQLGRIFDFVDDNLDFADLGHIGSGSFVPYQVCDCSARNLGEFPLYLSPAWRASCNQVKDKDLLKNLNNIDIVFTSDKSLWSRCVVVESMVNQYPQLAEKESGGAVSSQGDFLQMDLRGAPSVGKDDTNGDGLPEADGDGNGMGWFPGYALDVETGKRLNIFFGENSVYRNETGFVSLYSQSPAGADMLFNPNNQIFLPVNAGPQSPLFYYLGGQHYIYVTSTEYDSCAFLRTRFDATAPNYNPLRKVAGLKQITWAGLAITNTGTQMDALGNGPTGLVPNDFTVKLRVDNPYQVFEGTGDFNGYPTYRFKLEGKQADALDAAGIQTALDAINIVPNPYYGFSSYETSRLSTIAKITNLPAKCVITIYTLDGKFIRQYNRDEQPGVPFGDAIPSNQIIPDLEWDLKNSKGIPVAAGVYLIHVNAPGIGERTLKWFGIPRQFDPTGL
jgi:hypothetical protein